MAAALSNGLQESRVEVGAVIQAGDKTWTKVAVVKVENTGCF